jgi:hypothetical protein
MNLGSRFLLYRNSNVPSSTSFVDVVHTTLQATAAMNLNKASIRDADLQGKRVLMRVDLCAPCRFFFFDQRTLYPCERDLCSPACVAADAMPHIPTA